MSSQTNTRNNAVGSREAIQNLIRRILDDKGDRREFNDQDSLVLSGRLESVDVIEVIAFLEQNFGADFAEDGFNQEELDSVDKILARAER